jgi:transposase
VPDVAKRLGVSVQSLYKCIKAYAPNATDRYEAEIKGIGRENLKLKAELRRAQDERDILKNGVSGVSWTLRFFGRTRAKQCKARPVNSAVIDRRDWQGACCPRQAPVL